MSFKTLLTSLDFCHLCSAASYFFSTLVGNAALWHKANSRTVLSLEDLAVWLCWAPVQQGPRLPKQQNLELKMETHCGWEHHSQKYEISVKSLSDAFRHNSNLLESVKFLKELTCTDSGFWCYWCPMVSLKVLTCYGKNWWSRLADAVVPQPKYPKCLLQFDPTVSKCSWRLEADQCARSTRPSVRTTKENGLKNRTL